MTQRPIRQTERMHAGRLSRAGAMYFVTLVTERRRPWPAAPKATAAFVTVLRCWHDERRGAVLAVAVMPDHAHVLFELGERLSVGRTVARWKSAVRKSAGYLGAFQRDFWEHRVRESETLEDYVLYIFLNPYRAGLVRADCPWPGWWAPRPAAFRFSSLLAQNGAPPQEWVAWQSERFAGLTHGE